MSATASTEFKRKAVEIAANGNRPEDWKEYIDLVKQRTDENRSNRYQLLSFVYDKAMKSIPASNQSLAHAQLIVEYGELQRSKSESSAEKCFTYGRRILRQFAIIHVATAEFELKRGNKERALKVLRQARLLGAEPLSEINLAIDLLQEGRMNLRKNSSSDITGNESSYSSSEKESSDEISTLHTTGTFREHTDSSQVLPSCKTNTQEFEHGLSLLSSSSSISSSSSSFMPHTQPSHAFSTSPVKPQPPKYLAHPLSSSSFGHIAPPSSSSSSIGHIASPSSSSSSIGHIAPPSSSSSSLFGHKAPPSSSSFSSIGHKPPPSSSTMIGHIAPPSSSSSSIGHKPPPSSSSMIGHKQVSEQRTTTSGHRNFLKCPESPVLLSSLQDPDMSLGNAYKSNYKLPSSSLAENSHLKFSSHILQSHQLAGTPKVVGVTPQAQKSLLTGMSGMSASRGGGDAGGSVKKTLSKYYSSPSVVSISSATKNSTRKPNLKPPRRVLKTHTEEELDNDMDNQVGDITVSAFKRFDESKPSTVDLGIANTIQRKTTLTMDTPANYLSLSTPAKNCEQKLERKAPFSASVSSLSDVVSTASLRTSTSENGSSFLTAVSANAPKELPEAMKSSEPLEVVRKPANIERHLKDRSVEMVPSSTKENVFQQQHIEPNPELKPSMSRATDSIPSYQKDPANILKPAQSNTIPNSKQKTKWVNGKAYTVLKLVGRGGSAKVFQVFDPSTGSNWALKVVDLSDSVVAEGYSNEIHLLQQLQHCDKVIKLKDWEYDEALKKLYLVMEYGDTDMENFLKSGENLSNFDTKYFWRQMVIAVHAMHKEGVIHSDLKPANFLLVRGKVRLIDFGIARALQQDKTSVFKECRMGTPSYMSPEMLVAHRTAQPSVGAKPQYKVGVRSDVWSLGCILYRMVYGHTPFQHIAMEKKFDAIVNPNHVIDFPMVADPLLLDILKKCLTRDMTKRPTSDDLLTHPYICKDTTEEKAAPPKPTSLLTNLQLLDAENIATASPRSQKALLQRLKELQDKVVSSLDSKLSSS